MDDQSRKKSSALCLAPCSLRFARPRSAAAEESPADRVFIVERPITESTRSEGIRQALHDLGYVEGQNIAFEYRYAEGKLDRFPELAAELVRLKVDIIVVAGGNTLIRAAKNATKTISIVMAGAAPILSRQVSLIALPIPAAMSPALLSSSTN